MTLKECKDQVAKKNGFDDWWSIDFNKTNISQEALRDEAAELYARSKWESGLNEAIKKFEEAKSKAETLRDVIYLDGVLTILDLTKPEFK